MSKVTLRVLYLMLVSAFAWVWPVIVVAQESVDVKVRVDPSRGVAAVEGSFSQRPRNELPGSLSFPTSAIGYPDLGSRVSNVKLLDENGESLAFLPLRGAHVIDPAKNLRRSGISRFSYEVDLLPPANSRAAAHVSWANKEVGLLLFDDILPGRFLKRASIKLELPVGWEVITTLKVVNGYFLSSDISKATALVGPRIRQRSDQGTTIATRDSWQFSDDQAMTASSEITRAYEKVLGANNAEERLVLLVRFPQPNVPKGTWEAETRGNTVILATSDMAFEGQALQRLAEQLRHEIFHWWFPNGVALTGNYDWFYEGFALYQSLKTGVALNQISFNDFLDTLSRAHTIDGASSAGRLSLIEASAARWSGLETQVYARGMLVAFLCDMTLLHESKGKTSLEPLLRELFRKYAELPEDGNTAVLRLLDSRSTLQPIVNKYIRGSELVDWSAEIAAAGIENESGNSTTKLKVGSKLTRKQKTLLDKLGYNSWRKLTQK